MKRLQFDSASYLFVPGEGSKDLEYCEHCGVVRVVLPTAHLGSGQCPVCGEA